MIHVIQILNVWRFGYSSAIHSDDPTSELHHDDDDDNE